MVIMKIDQDIGFGKSKPTNLTNISKKSVLIGIGLVILIILIALIIIFQPVAEEPIINYDCEKRLNLDLDGVTAVFADGATKNTLISADGENASFIQFYENKVLIESIVNSYKDTNNAEEKIINLLIEKNVKNVATADASQEMKNILHEKDIKCYALGGAISYLIDGVQEVVDTSFCKKLVDQNLMGKTVFGSDNNSENSLVAIKINESPYLIVYQDLDFNGIIQNTAVDSNYLVDDFIVLLKTRGIENIILAEYEDATEEKLKEANINCYEAGGEINSFFE
jgi:predicted Fe-Mo cluster-binding NifX family protein